MSMAYSPNFAWDVITGYALTVLGAVLSLAAGVWWMRAGEWARGEAQPPAFRALCVAAFALFIVGLFWQLLGYLRLEYTSGW
jgi:hypothetical protein